MTWVVTWSIRVTWFLTWTLIVGANLTKHNSSTRVVCKSPFQPVGSRCLFVDHLISGTWSDMAEVCKIVGGHLVTLEDANVLSHIFNHLQENGQNEVSYWVGGNDQVEEGSWVWSYDLSPIHMGSPLWGDLSYPDGVMQPTGGVVENCAIMNHKDDFYLHDTNCEESHAVICEDPVNKATTAAAAAAEATAGVAVQPVSPNIKNNVETNTSTFGCMTPYEMIGGRCLFVETLGTGNWYDRKVLCEALGGSMLKLGDANLLGDIYDYLVTNGIIAESFWIGASDEDKEGVWKWLDGVATVMGTPYWGNFGMGSQEPTGGTAQNCAALNKMEHFLMHDYECKSKTPTGVICEY